MGVSVEGHQKMGAEGSPGGRRSMGEENFRRCEECGHKANALVQGVLGTQTWVTFLFDELILWIHNLWEELQEG